MSALRALACVAGVALGASAASAPAPKAEAPAPEAAPTQEAVPIAVLTRPDGSIVTPFDCGSMFCTVPRDGWAAVFIELKTLSRENTELKAKVEAAKGRMF